MQILNRGKTFEVTQTTSGLINSLKDTNDFHQNQTVELLDNCDFEVYWQYATTGVFIKENAIAIVTSADFLNDEAVLQRLFETLFQTNLVDYYSSIGALPVFFRPREKTSDEIWERLLRSEEEVFPKLWPLLPQRFKDQKGPHELIMGKILGMVTEEWKLGTTYVFGNGPPTGSRTTATLDVLKKFKVAKIALPFEKGNQVVYILLPKDFNGNYIITLSSNIIQTLTVEKYFTNLQNIDCIYDLYTKYDFEFYSKHAKIYLSKTTGLIGDDHLE